MTPASRDFCQNMAKEDGIREHMEKYRDIFCMGRGKIPEFKDLADKSDIKDIRKVNNTNLSTNYNTALQS